MSSIHHYCCLVVLKYIIEVHTGREPGCDSKINVHAQLFGTRGDTGKRKLLKSIDNAPPKDKDKEKKKKKRTFSAGKVTFLQE